MRYRTFFDGHLQGYRAAVVLQPAPGVSLTARASFNDARLASGSFHSRLFLGRLDLNLTTRHLVSTIVQYDNGSRLAGLQLRFRWLLRPGSELFAGYLLNAVDDTSEDRWETVSREAQVKAGTTIRW